jgi:uncharacterized protein (UPF0212 family)
MIKFIKTKTQMATAAFTSGVIMSIAKTASANTTTDLNSTVERVGAQANNIPQLINGAFFVAGIGLVGLGLFGVKKHVDSNGQEKLPPALAKAGIGGALMALPILADNAINTVVSGGSGASITAITSSSTKIF